MTLENLIKKRRLELNMSQATLARLLGQYKAQYICNIENGRSKFPRKKLKRLCRVLMMDQSTVYNVLLKEEAQNLAKQVGFSE